MLDDLAAQDDPQSDRRRIKRISTPLYAFAWSVRNICKELLENSGSYSSLSEAVKEYVGKCRDEMMREVPLSGDSPLRYVRNKIDAHVDLATVKNPEGVWRHVELRNYMPWIACSLITFKRLMALDVYGWTCESNHPDIFRLMGVDGTLVDLMMEDGQPNAIAGITQTTSPKDCIAEDLNAVITAHNTLLQSIPRSRQS